MRKFLNFFGFDKIVKTFNMIQQNGGYRASLKKLYLMETMRSGKLIGEDKYGNKYYEDLSWFVGRHRFVEYPKYKNLEYDGAQISPEWFGWMHWKNDYPPNEDLVKMKTKYKWMLDHSENLSGTKDAYMPYSTTKPKIEAWDPKKKDNESM